MKQRRYVNFAELASREVEGRDYRIVTRERGSDVLVMAIHAGLIEIGTSPLAIELAALDWNLYLFEGTKTENNMNLHVTSTRFDEPRALAMATRARICISIHGHWDLLPAEENICMGGANLRLKSAIYAALKATGLLQQNEENPCRRYEALASENIANRCAEGGVQLEISRSLRRRLEKDTGAREVFIGAIRRAVESYKT